MSNTEFDHIREMQERISKQIAAELTPEEQAELDFRWLDNGFHVSGSHEAVDKIRIILQANGIGPLPRHKKGDLVKITSKTQHEGQTGRILGLKASFTDMVGLVERYWVEFAGDETGPYPYDDHDFEAVSSAEQHNR